MLEQNNAYHNLSFLLFSVWTSAFEVFRVEHYSDFFNLGGFVKIAQVGASGGKTIFL